MASESPSKEPYQLTAAEALPLLRNGKLTVTDYAKSLLNRIDARDNAVRAWVYKNPGLILQQAAALDAVPSTERRPLHGLPIGVKDVILTKDMPTQYNSKIYESETPIATDANCIMTLRASGALIFGKTATTEFASTKQGGHHQNLTSNAYSPNRTPGGSSSGSGAAVADYQVPIALGTQTGGSIVRPASFNGCHGFKPTHGAISREGLAQWCPTLDTCGFFARSIEDFEVLSDVFRLRDDEPAPSSPFQVKGAKIAMCKTHNWPNAGPGTIKAMEKAADLLREAGAEVSDLELPEDFSKVLEYHATVLAGEGQASFLGQSLLAREHVHPSILSYVDNDRNVSRKQLLEAYDSVARLRPVWDSIAARYDCILTPSVVDEAPMGLEDTGDMSFASTWTILHAPAVNLVGFRGENGMPVGLTAVTGRYRDSKLLHTCKEIARLFEAKGGWKAG